MEISRHGEVQEGHERAGRVLHELRELFPNNNFHTARAKTVLQLVPSPLPNCYLFS